MKSVGPSALFIVAFAAGMVVGAPQVQNVEQLQPVPQVGVFDKVPDQPLPSFDVSSGSSSSSSTSTSTSTSSGPGHGGANSTITAKSVAYDSDPEQQAAAAYAHIGYDPTLQDPDFIRYMETYLSPGSNANLAGANAVPQQFPTSTTGQELELPGQEYVLKASDSSFIPYAEIYDVPADLAFADKAKKTTAKSPEMEQGEYERELRKALDGMGYGEYDVVVPSFYGENTYPYVDDYAYSDLTPMYDGTTDYGLYGPAGVPAQPKLGSGLNSPSTLMGPQDIAQARQGISGFYPVDGNPNAIGVVPEVPVPGLTVTPTRPVISTTLLTSSTSGPSSVASQPAPTVTGPPSPAPPIFTGTAGKVYKGSAIGFILAALVAFLMV